MLPTQRSPLLSGPLRLCLGFLVPLVLVSSSTTQLPEPSSLPPLRAGQSAGVALPSLRSCTLLYTPGPLSAPGIIILAFADLTAALANLHGGSSVPALSLWIALLINTHACTPS